MYTLYKDGNTCTAEKSQLKVMLAAGWSTTLEVAKVEEPPVPEAPEIQETPEAQNTPPESEEVQGAGVGGEAVESEVSVPRKKRRKVITE